LIIHKSCGRAFALALLGAGLMTPVVAQEFVRGRALVKFRASATALEKGAALRAVNARSTRDLGSGIQLIELPSISNESAAAAKLNGSQGVEFAELDQLHQPAADPNDPWLSAEWYLTKISAPGAWAYNPNGSNITIAILDTGVELSHPDLAANLVPGWNTYDGNSNAWDVHGHGTGVAGVASSVTNNGLGVASLAWNAKLMPIRVTNASGYASSSTIVSGLSWAADRGARVANISFAVSDISSVKTASQNFMNRGGVVCIAAGNDGTTSTASDNPYALTVSATDGSDQIYSWSNRGSNVDVAAPGSVHTTGLSGSFGGGAGTSYSSPIVASMAAMIFSANPSLSPNQVMSIIESTCDDLGSPGWDGTFASGRVNAKRALEMVIGGGGGTSNDDEAPTVALTSPSNGATVSGTINLSANASDNVGVASVAFFVDGTQVGSDSAAPFSVSWNSTAAANGSHTIVARAFDATGNQANSTISVTVSNAGGDTTPPSVSILSPTSGSNVNNTVSIQAKANDNVGVAKVELYVDGVLKATSTTAPFTTKWNARKASRGSHTLQLRATDSSGNTAWSSSVTVNR